MFGRLFVADAKMILRNKQALFFSLIFPLIFATVFGLFGFDDLPDAKVAVLAEDERAALPIRAGLESVDAFQICGGKDSGGDTIECGAFEPGEPAAVARAALADGDVDFILSIDGGGRALLVVNNALADSNRIFVPIFARVVDGVNMRLADVQPRYVLEQESVSGQAPKYYDFILPGLVGMAVMTYGIIGLATTITQYRGQRILRRILATPLKPSTFIGSIVAAHLALAVVQSAIVLGFGMLAFGANVRGSILAMLPFVLLGNLTFLNIGFMVASRVQSTEAASGLGNAVSIPMMFFSGVFFPTTTLPWILPEVTRLLPLRPLVDAIRSISLDGIAITELGPEFAQLAAWAIVTFVIASRMFRFERA